QVDIVDLAGVPSVPIGTGRTPRIVLALLLGLGLGSLVSYVLENHTLVVRRREEVERLAMVPVLAIIPALTDDRRNRGRRLLGRMRPRPSRNGNRPSHELVTSADSRSVAAETFRTLRTNLLFSAAVQSMREVLVTSAGSSEGK